MGKILSIVALLWAAQGGRPALKAPSSRPALAAPKPLAVSNFTVYPIGSVSFAATDPDSPTVSGSSSITVSGLIGPTTGGESFKLEAYSVNPSFSSCPTAIPVSAVTITCASLFNPGNNAVSCAAPIELSTSKQTVASGTLPDAGSSTSFWVNFTYALTDKWTYIAQTSSSCTLNVTYVATVN